MKMETGYSKIAHKLSANSVDGRGNNEAGEFIIIMAILCKQLPIRGSEGAKSWASLSLLAADGGPMSLHS